MNTTPSPTCRADRPLSTTAGPTSWPAARRALSGSWLQLRPATSETGACQTRSVVDLAQSPRQYGSFCIDALLVGVVVCAAPERLLCHPVAVRGCGCYRAWFGCSTVACP